VANSRKVTSQTRTRVAAINSQFVRALAQSGMQSSAIAEKRNGSYGAGSFPSPPAGFGGAGFSGVAGYSAAVGAPTQYVPPMPMLGAFIHNIAAQSQSARVAATTIPTPLRAAARLITRGGTPTQGTAVGTGSGDSGGAPNGPTIPVTFGYDDFLGLWVNVQNTAKQTTFMLFVDQAQTQPAGSIVTTIPSGSGFSQVYTSTYQFTAGLFARSHGSYQTTLNQDGSGASTYSDDYADGSSDSGSGNWTAKGASSWSNKSTDSAGGVTRSSGTFNADGSGVTHAVTADGYTLDYTYNADGSGAGKISGPAAGLPATVTWDVYGDATITYADGTVDYIAAWSVPPATVTTSSSGAPPQAPAAGTSNTPPAPPQSPTSGTGSPPPAPPSSSTGGAPPAPPGH